MIEIAIAKEREAIRKEIRNNGSTLTSIAD